MSDAAGAVVEKYTYSAYGESGNEGDGGFPFRFTGQKLDAETGLYYYKARYYDPETGRFLQTDPIGYRDQMNLYAYVGNDPMNGTDPTGLKVENPDDFTVDEDTLKKLNDLDEKTPGVDYTITSGQRSEKKNKDLKGAKNSRHIPDNGGDAVDVNPTITDDAAEGTTTESIAEKASDVGFTGIIIYTKEDGTSNNANGGRLHLDRRDEKYHARQKKNSKGEKYYEDEDFDGED